MHGDLALPVYLVVRRITLKDIAERAGVTKMTVSLALRGAGRLNQETVERIRRLSAEMGYVPDPALSALNTHKQQLKTTDKGEVIAFLVDGPDPEPWLEQKFIDNFKVGAERGAQALGYRLQPFWRGEYKDDRLGKILNARGIRALLLAPEPVEKPEKSDFGIAWEKFSIVKLGRSHPGIHVPSVTHDHYGAMQLVLKQLSTRGYRRPAFICTARSEERVQYRYSACFQFLQQQLPPEDRLPVIVSQNLKVEKRELLDFCQLHQPDVCIAVSSGPLFYLENSGYRLPEDIGFVCLDIQENQPGVSGICQDLGSIGKASVELLDFLMRTNTRGLSRRDHTVVLGGSWQEGGTVR